MNVLVINAGSSSLKYQLLNPTTGELLVQIIYILIFIIIIIVFV